MKDTNAKNDLTLEITSLSYGPYGIGRDQGKTVMVPHTAPGDNVTARIVEEKDRYAVGEIVRVIESSPARRLPPCPYVGDCGGCSWQHVLYDTQLKAKQQSVADALRRIGKLDGFELRPIIASPAEYGYRRRIRLQMDCDNRLGFYHASSHRLVEIDSCSIAVDAVNACIAPLRAWARVLHTTLEYVEIVAGEAPGEGVVVAGSSGEFSSRDEAACRELLEREPRIRGLIVAAGPQRKTWGDTRITVVPGADTVTRVEADVFTQVNPGGNRIMVRELLAAGNFTAEDRALELYSGAGNFTLPLAKHVREIVAVEGYRLAVASAKLAAQSSGLSKIRWIVSGVPAAIEKLAVRRERFTKIILDPPRAGAKGIERALARLGAERIVYVSCNPTTLARDLAALSKQGYKLGTVQPIDLFPQTFHVEAIATIERAA